jgi:putative flippase GtrA
LCGIRTTKGGTVVEVPVEFVDRVRGATKLGFSDMIEFFFNVVRLRVQDSRTIFKLAAVGLSGAFVNLGIFLLITRLGVNKFIASPIAIETSIISNFLLNNYWTFRERNPADRVAIRGLKFGSVSDGLVSELHHVCGSLPAFSRESPFPGRDHSCNPLQLYREFPMDFQRQTDGLGP